MSASANEVLNNYKRLPKLFVFDLDYTVWPFWCDTHVTPPFHFKNKKLVDRRGYKIELYDDVIDIFDAIKSHNIKMAYASRTGAYDVAIDLLSKLHIEKYVQYQEIYPGTKVRHFNEFKKNSNIPFEEMIFFDDEHRNIIDVGKLGVLCKYVPDGLNLKSFEEALIEFQKHK